MGSRIVSVPKPLPLIGSHPGGRSALTCRFRCGDACFHEVPNTSGNAYAGDVIAGAVRRRALLRGAAVTAVVAATGAAGATVGAPGASAAPGAPAAPGPAGKDRRGARGLRFEPVAPNTADAVTVPEGYRQNVVVRWGSRSCAGRPRSIRRTRARPRRRASSATTTTSSRSCRSPANAAGNSSSPITSTRTRC